MRLSGRLLLLAAAAACLTAVHSLPAELPVDVVNGSRVATPVEEEGPLPSSGWGLASLDALAQRINAWIAPVVDVIEEAVKNKTVSEVVVDARNATVLLATRVTQSEAVQGAKEAISPLTRLFERVHDRVKDKTLQELAGDVQRQIQRLDESVADFIRGLGEDEDPEDQDILAQILPVQETPEGDPEQAAAAAALDQPALEENEVEP